MKASRISFVLACWLFAGCATESSSSVTPAPKSHLSGGIPVGAAAFVPVRGGDPSCEWTSPAPALCDWACLHDAVFIGEIVSVAASVSPATLGRSENGTEDCPGESRVLPAVEITVVVLDTLRGEVPNQVTVVVPREAADLWSVSPQLGDNNTIDWQGGGEVEFLAVGSLIGLRASQVEGSDRWSAGFNLPFTFDVNWLPVFEQAMCVEPITLPSGTTYNSFRETLSACPESAYCEEAKANWADLPAAVVLGARCSSVQ